ncbi:hypothetical protein DID77_01585 [Candidatus Marinamargulisbacteria bacterium SCGC AG-439-L15]|nr:hypothetical protein DID77_01585 [Candidatus Marinamargulisbacteria bacterium SCGC AG-439-L15]
MNFPLSVSAVDQGLLSSLKRAQQVTVHSCFDQAVNLLSESGFISVLRSEKALSFKSCSVQTTHSFRKMACFSEGTLLTLTKEGIFHKKTVILCFKEAQPYNPTHIILETLAPKQLHYFQAYLSKNGCFDPMISRKKHALKEALQTSKKETIAQKTCALIGLGSGLSPSGDDFLSGLMGTLTLLSLQENRRSISLLNCLEKVIKERYDGTTFMGKSLLQNGIKGGVPRCILDIITAIYSTHCPDVEGQAKLMQTALSLGHFSGSEILDGCLTALGYVLIENIKQREIRYYGETVI